jgi:hypothetical protein
MADHSETEMSSEKPTQGNFIGWLALVLMLFALAWMATGLIAGATHGWQ